MAEVKITFCNRAYYADNRYKNLRRYNGYHFNVIQAIITEIVDEEGLGTVNYLDLYLRN
jgi:hypothetical protein